MYVEAWIMVFFFIHDRGAYCISDILLELWHHHRGQEGQLAPAISKWTPPEIDTDPTEIDTDQSNDR